MRKQGLNVSGLTPAFSMHCQRSPVNSQLIEKTIELIHKAPLKQSALDPIPTWILKECASELTPFISKMFNLSMSSGIVPLDFKTSFISPILKKFTLDKTDVNSYRPISNLSVISKLLERVVCSQLVCYLDANSLIQRNQICVSSTSFDGVCIDSCLLGHNSGTGLRRSRAALATRPICSFRLRGQ